MDEKSDKTVKLAAGNPGEDAGDERDTDEGSERDDETVKLAAGRPTEPSVPTLQAGEDDDQEGELATDQPTEPSLPMMPSEDEDLVATAKMPAGGPEELDIETAQTSAEPASDEPHDPTLKLSDEAMSENQTTTFDPSDARKAVAKSRQSGYRSLAPRPDAPDAPMLGPDDPTASVGYAASITGFHQLHMFGHEVPLRRPRRVVFAISLTLGLATTAALAVTLLQAWTHPARISVLAGGAVVLAAALSALVGAGVWKHAARGAAVGAAMGLVCSLGCVFIAAAWSMDGWRAQVLTDWQGRSKTLHDALDDPSDTVAATACRELVAREDPRGRTLLVPRLTVSPGAATGCLSDHESPFAREIAREIANRWSRELAAAEQTSLGRFEEVAAALPTLPIPPAERDVRLFHCAFNAPTEVARMRCSDVISATFSADGWGRRLAAMVDVGANSETARGILAMAVDSPALQPQYRKLAKLVDASAPLNQWAALRLAHGAIARGSTEPVLELRGALEGECEIDVVDLQTSRDTWFAVTSEALERGADPTEPMIASLCAVASTVFTREAIVVARQLVRASASRTGEAEASKIDAGWLLLNKDEPQTRSALRSMIPEGASEEEAQKMMRLHSLGVEGEVESNPLFQGDPVQ